MKFSKIHARRGMSLMAFVLVMGVLALGFIFLLAQWATTDRMLQSRTSNWLVSEQMAKSALQYASNELQKDRTWGRNGEAFIWRSQEVPGAVAYISFRYNGKDDFDPTPEQLEAAEAVGTGNQSINNLGGENVVVGPDGMVESVGPNGIVVVAVGKYRNKTDVAYQIYTGSPVPYSLASQGSLKVTGETVVGGLDSFTRAQELPDQLAGDDLSESGIVSNSSDTNAVELDGDIQIQGNVEAVGGVRQGAGVKISGEVKQISDLAELPDIRISDYDPKGDPNDPSDDLLTLVERSETTVADAVNNPLYGFQRFSQTTTFPDGLKLDGSAVYVDGDVILDGPLEGSGLLMATGNVTLRGGADLDADVLAAVISGGDLTVNGQTSAGAAASQFNGLLYSKGDLTLSNTRTIGTVVSASDAAGVPGKLVIEDSQVISTPQTDDFRLVVKTFAPAGPVGQAALAGAGGNTGNGWQVLEPNPANLLTKDANGNPVFIWDDAQLKIRVQQSDDSWRVISHPNEAVANGLSATELSALENRYLIRRKKWEDELLPKLNDEYRKELVDIIDVDINEFLKTSSRLQAKRGYFKN